MIVPHPNFRLNPSRAIYITGRINDDLVSKLTPVILKLQNSSRNPISVYIDSPGGSVSSMETILRLLKLPDQNSSEPCRILTTVTRRAASAAADLLSSGDYATAYSDSMILYHGMRTREDRPLTRERTSMLADLLRFTDDAYAMELAEKIEGRFSLRYVFARREFDDVRKKHGGRPIPDVDCFIEITRDKLSTEARNVWAKAVDRHEKYRQLFDGVIGKVRRRPISKMTTHKLMAASIKTIVDFELEKHKDDPSWDYRGTGISQVADDFFCWTSICPLGQVTD